MPREENDVCRTVIQEVPDTPARCRRHPVASQAPRRRRSTAVRGIKAGIRTQPWCSRAFPRLPPPAPPGGGFFTRQANEQRGCGVPSRRARPRRRGHRLPREAMAGPRPSVGRSLARSVGRSVGRSVACSFGRSVVRSVGRLVVGSFVGSVGWSNTLTPSRPQRATTRLLQAVSSPTGSG